MARKYFVYCEDDCKFESMTKEQILTAIQQAVEGGEIHDVNTGFVTTLNEINHNRGLRVWVGTTAEFNRIPPDDRDVNVLYIRTDDTTAQDMQAQIDQLEAAVSGIGQMTELTGGSLDSVFNDGWYRCQNAALLSDAPVDTPFVMQIVTVKEGYKTRILYPIRTIADGGLMGMMISNYDTATSRWISWIGVCQYSMLLSGKKLKLTVRDAAGMNSGVAAEIDLSDAFATAEQYTALEARVAALEGGAE